MPGQRLIDGRDMLPPEPLERTLAELDSMEAGDELVLLLYCEPHPLYAILKRNGYTYQSELREDGTNAIRISKT